jgi:hypothetical protein
MSSIKASWDFIFQSTDKTDFILAILRKRLIIHKRKLGFGVDRRHCNFNVNANNYYRSFPKQYIITATIRMYKNFNVRTTKMEKNKGKVEEPNPKYMLKKLLQDIDNLKFIQTENIECIKCSIIWL